jgi:hypothetical protein
MHIHTHIHTCTYMDRGDIPRKLPASDRALVGADWRGLTYGTLGSCNVTCSVPELCHRCLARAERKGKAGDEIWRYGLQSGDIEMSPMKGVRGVGSDSTSIGFKMSSAEETTSEKACFRAPSRENACGAAFFSLDTEGAGVEQPPEIKDVDTSTNGGQSC